jgi:hypothetical protein
MIGASNKGPRACWVHTDAGMCREPPRPGKHTCLKHREQEDKGRGVVRMFLKHRERYSYGPNDGLCPWVKRIDALEAALAVGHGVIDEVEATDAFADVHGLTPDVVESRRLFLAALERNRAQLKTWPDWMQQGRLLPGGC